jgi:hypothetical protein
VIVAKRKATETTAASEGKDDGQAQEGETISGYFRRLFKGNSFSSSSEMSRTSFLPLSLREK